MTSRSGMILIHIEFLSNFDGRRCPLQRIQTSVLHSVTDVSCLSSDVKRWHIQHNQGKEKVNHLRLLNLNISLPNLDIS